MPSFLGEVMGLRSLVLVLMCVVNYGTYMTDAVKRDNLKSCSEKPLELREEMANVVLSGFIGRVMREPRKMMYDCEVEVVRVFKGSDTLENDVEPAMSGNKLKISGFGDPLICDNVAHSGDTRVMLLNKDANGHLKLNSSLIRITLGNLDRAEAAVSDIPYISREPVTDGPCSTHLCAFGAICQEKDARPICACPQSCNEVFSPVCGSDAITYMNECYLKVASCTQMTRITIDMEGPCDTTNPCDTKECSFGAECMLTPDRTMAKCVCPQDCEESPMDPICGSDGVDYMNECELRRASCLERRTVDIIYYGKCDPCEDIEFDGAICKLDFQRKATAACHSTCDNEDYSPVCASDGNVYDNDCAMQRAACIRGVELAVYKLGECDPGAHPCETHLCEFGECVVDDNGFPSCVCGPECPEVYKPVCGSDGMTYYSMCHLVSHSCLTKTTVQVKDMMACPQDLEDICSSAICLYGAMCMVENGAPVCTCDLMCTLEISPVCGSDGMTYANECQLKQVACEQQESVMVEYEGPCETCDNAKCEFGAICEMSSLGPQCVCPEGCVPFESPVCGSDGTTYENECQLNVKACMLQEEIYVVSQGSCDECEGVVCEYGSMCNRGSCMCPTCAEIFDPVCGTDMETYSSPCHLQGAMCIQRNKISVLYVGECDEMSGSGGSGSDLEGSGGLPLTEECDETSCGFGGKCVELPNGMSYCSCSMNCSATRKPVCGSDSMTYGSECIMREASCEQQSVITVGSFASCEDVEMEPCDGDTVLSDAEGNEYTCSEDPNAPGCPSGSYCHIHPMDKFAVCCPEQTTPPTCEDTSFGCCPDGMTAAQGKFGAGCPSMCDCNELGSYSPICDAVSQQCACKPGVGGKKCDRCEPGFWDFRGIQLGNIGCRPCACNKAGSIRDDCEQMFGQCICKPDVMGSKCDVCPSGMTMASTGCEGEGIEGPEEPVENCEESGCPFNADCLLVEGVPTCTCPSECYPLFQPVCGTDGQTYANECQLRLFSCRLQKDIMLRTQGTCETFIETPTMEPVDCNSSEFGCCPDGESIAMSEGGGGCPTSIPGISTPIPISGASEEMLATMITPPATMATDGEGVTSLTEMMGTDQTGPEELKNETTSGMTSDSMQSTSGMSLTTEGTPMTSASMLQTLSTIATSTEEPPMNMLGCASDPCLHGGTCVNYDDMPGFMCSCPLGKGGPVCEQDVMFDIPSFMERSYLAFPKMVAYFEVDIVLEFKVENEEDALIMWNGYDRDSNEDFISLAIVDNQVEFRYDLGTQEPVVIRSNTIIKPHNMHRIKATRFRRDGTLSVDDEPEVKGSSPGRSSGLSLNTDLYLGSGPPEMKQKIKAQTGVVKSLTGCIRDVVVNNLPFILSYPGGDILYGANVGECDSDPCLMNPCMNNGTCEAITATDFKCMCINNFIGPLCGDVLADQCEGHMCHHSATCVPLPEGGYRCDCPMGRKGDLCDKVIEMDFIPAFKSNSYIELPAMEGMDTITVEMEFLTKDDNGMLFYNGDNKEVDGDFISLNLKDGFLEYRYDLGSGPAEIRSLKRVTHKEWHTVEVTRVGKDGMMIVDGEEPVSGESQGVSSDLNLEQHLFLGGTNNFTQLSRKAGITDGFQGGIKMLAINNREMYDFVSRAINEINIVEYVDEVCISQPCLETYNCRAAGTGYECVCPDGFFDLGNQCVPEEDGGSGDGSGDFTDFLDVGTTTTTASPSDFKSTSSDFMKTADGFKTTASPEVKRTTMSVLSTSLPELKRTTSPENMATTSLETVSESKTTLSDTQTTTMSDFNTEQMRTTSSVVKIPTPSNIRSGTRLPESRTKIQVSSPEPTVQATSLACNCTNSTTGTMVTGVPTETNAATTREGVQLTTSQTQLTTSQELSTDGDGKLKPCRCGIPPPELPEFPQRNFMAARVPPPVGMWIGSEMFDKDIVTDDMIPDSTKRAPEELAKTTPRMSSAQIVMTTQTSPRMSTGRKTTANRNKDTTPNRQTTNMVTTPQETDLATTAPIKGMTTAPSVNIDGPIRTDSTHFYSYQNAVSETKKAQMTNMIEVTFRTTDYDGMIMYNGVGPAPKMGDFLFISVYKGEVLLGYNLGSGFAKLKSPLFVADNKWHTVKVSRTQRDASLQVDQEDIVLGSSKPQASQLNTDGVLWIGHYESYPDNVYENYRNSFEGCIKDVKLDETPLHLYHDALDEQPTEFCPDD